MTTVTVFKNRKGDICGFIASGHADRNSSCGNDIYCAAISAITQTACIGLESVAKADPVFKVKDGYLSAFVKDEKTADVKCRTLFSTLVLGLKAFDEANPGYIQIFEEVQE